MSDQVRPGGRDLIVGLSNETFDDIVHRRFVRPPDRLIMHAAGSERIREVMVADPWRHVGSAVRRVVRRPATAAPASLLSTPVTRPVRLVRNGSTDTGDLIRSYRRYSRWIALAARRRNLVRPHLVSFNPLAAAFADARLFSTVTFYSRDDWLAYEPYRELWGAIDRAYEEVRAREIGVVAVSQVIMDRIAPTGRQRVVPNGVDAATWADPSSSSRTFQALPKPVVMYTGTLDERLSKVALGSIAAAIPNGTLVLVGPRPGTTAQWAAAEHDNVRIFGNVPPDELASMVSASDVCVVPHVRSRLTEAMSPLKVYEYIAAGRPVVATDLPPIQDIHPSVSLVRNDTDFGSAVVAALARGPLDDSERRRFIAENGWDARGDAVLDLIFDHERAL